MAAKPAGTKPAPSKKTSKPAAPAKKREGVVAPTLKTNGPDWECIERDYRSGVKTLRQIAEEHGITHGAINKRAKRDSWERDLAQKIQAKAEALVSKALVSTQVSKESRLAERQVVDANAQAIADIRLAHRRDIHRARVLTNALLTELDEQTDKDTLTLLGDLGDLMRRPDDNGQDRLNDLYLKVVSLPERSKTMKVLAESLHKLVDMERIAFGMDAKDMDKPLPGSTGYVPPAVTVIHVAPPVRTDDEDEAP